MFLEFNSFNELAAHCTKCTACGKCCTLVIDFSELLSENFDNRWFELNHFDFDEKVIKFSGTVLDGSGDEIHHQSLSTQFEVWVPIADNQDFIVNSDNLDVQFPSEYFEFFINAKCVCGSRHVASENIIVEHGKAYNFKIETEDFSTGKYWLSVRPEEEIISVYTYDGESHIHDLTIGTLDLDFTDMLSVNNKLGRYFSLL